MYLVCKKKARKVGDEEGEEVGLVQKSAFLLWERGKKKGGGRNTPIFIITFF